MRCPRCGGTGQEPNGHYSETARLILAFLNKKAGRNFQANPVNLTLIESRLKEGATEAQCRAVIGLKVAAWSRDETMAPYLRPLTLFSRQKFAQYQGELPASAFEPVAPEP